MDLAEFLLDVFSWMAAIAICGGAYILILWVLAWFMRGIK